jgi:stage II sporulation protein D
VTRFPTRLAGLTVLLLGAGCAARPAPEAPTPAPVAPAAAPPRETSPAPSPGPRLELSGEPRFDIGLAVGLDSVRLAPAREVTLRWRGPGGSPAAATTAAPLLIRASGVQTLVWAMDRPRAVPLAVLEEGDTLWIGDVSYERGDEALMRWNDRRWRGRFKVFRSPRSGLTVATRIGLEAYLAGVLPAEIGALRDSTLEAGRAQAIAARSYSLFYRGRRGAEGFDLYATVEDQVYGSVESEREATTRCVRSTAGVVALSEGQPIRANYSSTCGGISAEAWEAWPTEPRSYLRSTRDQGVGDGDHCSRSPHHRWTEEWSVGEFAAHLARYGPAHGVRLPQGGVGEIQDVRVVSRSRSGRVWRLAVTTTTGTLMVPAHTLRQVLRRGGRPDAILRSTLVKIAPRRDARGVVTAVVASGAGNGHGVGLCQTGALEMARRGARGEGILEHYYATSELVRLYTPDLGF